MCHFCELLTASQLFLLLNEIESQSFYSGSRCRSAGCHDQRIDTFILLSSCVAFFVFQSDGFRKPTDPPTRKFLFQFLSVCLLRNSAHLHSFLLLSVSRLFSGSKLPLILLAIHRDFIFISSGHQATTKCRIKRQFPIFFCSARRLLLLISGH